MNRAGAAAFGVVGVNLLTLVTVLAIGSGTDPSQVPDLASRNGLALLVLEGFKLTNGALLVVVVLALRERFQPDRIVDAASAMGVLAAAALAISGVLGAYLLITSGVVDPGNASIIGGARPVALIGAVELAGDVALAASGGFYLGINGRVLGGRRALPHRTALIGVVAGLLALLTVVVPALVGLPLLAVSCAWYWLLGRELASRGVKTPYPRQTGG